MISSLPNTSFGLASALTWGLGDFTGGQAAKKNNVFGVVVIADVAGLALVLALALGRGETFPTQRGVLFAALAGLIGGAALCAFYRCLAIGTMGINASIAALLTVAIPVLFGALTQGLPSRFQLAGFVLALAAIVLISLSDSAAARPRGLGLAILAGAGFGGFMVFSKLAGDLGLFWVLTVIRIASLALVLLIFWATQKRALPVLTGWPVAFVAGIMDVLGNFFYILAARSGRMDVSAVLASLYPAVTIVLAVVFLHERVNRRQRIGITAALAATLLLAY